MNSSDVAKIKEAIRQAEKWHQYDYWAFSEMDKINLALDCRQAVSESYRNDVDYEAISENYKTFNHYLIGLMNGTEPAFPQLTQKLIIDYWITIVEFHMGIANDQRTQNCMAENDTQRKDRRITERFFLCAIYRRIVMASNHLFSNMVAGMNEEKQGYNEGGFTKFDWFMLIVVCAFLAIGWGIFG